MAQFGKAAIELFKPRSLKSRDVVYSLLWRTGGMPSSHSSTTAALTTSLGFIEGMDSPIFISMLFFSMLVIRDALGVRRSAPGAAI